MKVAIMQPYFFPYIGYWQMINAVDKFVLFDDVNYIKKGWINRNNILFEGNKQFINLNISKASQNKKINELKIINDEDVVTKKLQQLTHAYKKSPYFTEVFPLLEDILRFANSNLAEYLMYSLKTISQYLNIETEFLYSSDIKNDVDLKASDRILQICKSLDATQYINAIGGQELYDSKSFSAKGIDLKFIKTGEIEYKQFSNAFIPNLSIIDVMMFNSVEELKNMLVNYTLV